MSEGKDLIAEHAILTSQASDEMRKAGAARIAHEREYFADNGMGVPDDYFLAGAAYEAMVFSVIKRGLTTGDPDIDDGEPR